jgi:preprotein translocase subunit SecE
LQVQVLPRLSKQKVLFRQDTVSARLSDERQWCQIANRHGVLNRKRPVFVAGEGWPQSPAVAEDRVSKETAQEKPKITERLKEYFIDTRGELRKVTWPTRKQATNLTLIVLGVTVAMALFLGGLDWVFANLIALILS